MFYSFAAVLWPHPGDVHGGLLPVTGGSGLSALHSHFLQVLLDLVMTNQKPVHACMW